MTIIAEPGLKKEYNGLSHKLIKEAEDKIERLVKNEKESSVRTTTDQKVAIGKVKYGCVFKYRNARYLKIDPIMKYTNWGLTPSSCLPYYYKDIYVGPVNCLHIASGKLAWLDANVMVSMEEE